MQNKNISCREPERWRTAVCRGGNQIPFRDKSINNRIGSQLEESITIFLFDRQSKRESDFPVKFASALSDIS